MSKRMRSKQTFDLGILERILLEGDAPLSLGTFQNEDNEPRLMCLWATMEYEQEITDFVKALIERHKSKDRTQEIWKRNSKYI